MELLLKILMFFTCMEEVEQGEDMIMIKGESGKIWKFSTDHNSEKLEL